MRVCTADVCVDAYDAARGVVFPLAAAVASAVDPFFAAVTRPTHSICSV